MKHLRVTILCIALLIGFTSTTIAGLIINKDDQKYTLSLIRPDGSKRSKLVSAKSTTNACPRGCTVTLVESEQEIKFGSKDKIIIKDGVMKLK